MRRVVIDPEAFLDWFSPGGRGLRAEYEEGALAVHVPRIFATHVLEVAARERKRSPERLVRLADEVERVGFVVSDVQADLLAAWLARGLTALQAPYAALAQSLGIPLVAGNADLRRHAGPAIQRS